MKKYTQLLFAVVAPFLVFSTGCASPGKWFPGISNSKDWTVKKVTSKWKAGVEAREGKYGSSSNRSLVQTGLEAELYNGQKVGVVYRRRDIGQGAGDNDGHDNGVWLTWSIPIWKDTSRDAGKKLEKMRMENRIAALEEKLNIHDTRN